MKKMYEFTVKRQYVGKVGEEEATYQIGSPDAVEGVIKLMNIHDSDQENFIVIYLDVRNNVKGFEKITRGLIDRSHVHPREVFKGAILHGAAKIILGHNHPSGDPTPSRQDIESTKNLVEAGDIIGIPVIDHIICTEYAGRYKQLSMRSAGHIS